MRTLLFVPADSERKLVKAVAAGSDALAIDLEDAVLPARKAVGREMLIEFAKTYSGQSELWVRVNDLTSGELLRDLACVAKVAPKGILLPKIRDRHDVETVQNYLSMAEAMAGLEEGSIKILAIATETPQIIMNMPGLAAKRPDRVVGLIWGAEDLSSAIGAGDPRQADGSWRPAYHQVRNQCLFAAHAMEVAVMDTVFVDFRDPEGCRRSAEMARYDGFTGKIAIHPDQIPIINEAFTPTAAEIAFAERVVAAFEGGAGSVSIDGKMFDVPHLKAARRMLEVAAKKR
jgi:citrate lyase subunit beta / citryl-CoA lyase